MIAREEIIPVGKFQKTHALKGELNMISDIAPEYFTEGNPVIIDYDGIYVPYYAETLRKKGSTSYLIKLEGIDSEEEASQFVNKEIFILKKDAEQWIEDEYEEVDSWIGFKIIDENSRKEIGEIEDIDDSTSNVLFITKDAEGETIYIPANEDFIVKIEEEEKAVYMRLPEGLLDLN